MNHNNYWREAANRHRKYMEERLQEIKTEKISKSNDIFFVLISIGVNNGLRVVNMRGCQ